MASRWAAIRARLRQLLIVATLLGAALLFIYVGFFTPFPVYVLDKLNLRPFFLPNIVCRRCNNFSYEYIIPNPDACKSDSDTGKDVYLLILVASYHANVNARQAIRRTWGGNHTHDGYRVKTLFVFGVHADKNFQRQLHFEQDKYGDVVQGNFSDFYRSLTNKTMMALNWVTKYCPKVPYVLKTDDDAFNVPARYVDYLQLVQTKHFIGGYCFTVMPDRWKSSKFYIPFDSYPEKYYPTYCSGPGYILSNSAVHDIVRVAPNVTYVHMEDVFVSGLARVAAGIQYTQIEGIVISRDDMTQCALATWAKNAHNVVPEVQVTLWEERVLKMDRERDCAGRQRVITVFLVLVMALWIRHMVKLLRR